ncbi:alkaline phosphatase [Methylophaga sp.]|uniref:alkaline phosphatase n=1 Tax=Methylophaga sp. TaxID=2024840 RepID=UPI003F69538A
MIKTVLAFLASVSVVTAVCAEEDIVPTHQLNNAWYQNASRTLAQKPVFKPETKAQNIILFVGDGMGISTVTAARILDGQNKGHSGEENQLSFESFPFTGLAKTYNVDAQTPDSAGTMTALMTGVKTDAGLINVDEEGVRGECGSVAGNELLSAIELAEFAGKSTGIVTTARVTHATPAATYARSPERNWEDISDLPQSAIDAGCEDIALQLVMSENYLREQYPEKTEIDGLDVVMGGGRRHFLPNDMAFNSPDALSEVEGDRTDGRHLIKEWQQRYPTGNYIYDQAGFDALDSQKTTKLLGLFNESHMRYEADRHNDKSGEPSLSEMTAKALDILDNNAKGYMLVVEAGRIDHAHHAGNAFNALSDTIELSNAVRVAQQKTNPEDTLIIVTADHSHVFTMAGYPKRGNPILGKVVNVGENEPAEAADGLPYTTLGYANGLGFRDHQHETDADSAYSQPASGQRTNLAEVDTQQPGYHQEALVPLSSETHGGEDVAVYASGPGAAGILGVNEQNLIFHVMMQAAGLK